MMLLLIIFCGIVQVSFGCDAEARRLHDMERRTKNYTHVIGEPLVTDYKIKEGWYSLDQYRLVVDGSGNLTGGSCGTRFQIVLQEGSTINWDTVDQNSITLTAVVYGRPEGHGEDLEISVRKCDDAFQFYLKPPSIRLAAYCFDSMETDPVTDEEDNLIIPRSVSLSLQGSLNFREELRDGQSFDVPYVSLTCYVKDPYLVNSFPELKFITITWFADNARIKSSGPLSLSNDESGNLASSDLTDDEFLDAGFSIGAVIRCGAQVSQSVSGKLSSMNTTFFDTNLEFIVRSFETSDNSARFMLIVQHPVPIGCLAPVGSTEQTCTLKLRVIREDGTLVCSEGPEVGDEHALCGITLFGQTKNGKYDQYRHYTNADGTNIYETDVAYVHVIYTQYDADRPSNYYFSVAVLDNTTGHAMWDQFRVHNAKANLEMLEDQGVNNGQYLVISQTSVDSHSRPQIFSFTQHLSQYQWYPETQIIEEAGKYILLWSRKFPFTAEVEVELINETLNLCGVYLRYGNDIYAYIICGDVFIEGLIFGDGKYIPQTRDNSVTLQEVGLQMHTNYIDGELSISFGNTRKIESDSFEGIGSISAMVGRYGNVYTDVSAQFLQSWRIDESESLSNPDNHIYYSLESKYTTCGCPMKTVDIPERDTVISTDDEITYCVYTGALHCNLDDVCSDITAGGVWPTTLLVDYLIEEVRVGSEQRVDGAGEPLLWFTCQFNSVQDKFYTVIWHVDGVEVKRIEAGTSDMEFGLNEADIGADFFFDITIRCSVSVLDLGSNVLISPLMSEVFQPIVFLKSNIEIQRGRDSATTWVNNIPFLCHEAYAECHMDLQVQVITMACWNSAYWTPTCACALVFQAGRDIYLIDRCNGSRFSGFLIADDDVLDVYEVVDNRYKVIFPNTLMVDVRVMPDFAYVIDVDVYPSPNEKDNLVGLCGNFNGDPNDDFHPRDTLNEGTIEDFSMSWELHGTGKVEEESLLEETNYKNPRPWNSEQKLCVCPNAHDVANTPSSPLCSVNEEKTCTKPKNHKGKKLDHTKRPKRETGEYVNLDVERRVGRLRRGIAEQHAIHRKRRVTLSNPINMNEIEARAICEEKFANAPINNLTAKLIPENQFLKDCIYDLQASGIAEWAKPQVIALTSRNEIAIERNTTFTKEYPEVVEAMAQICSHDCYEHGTCKGNDECLCYPGWGRKTCILDLTIGPDISYITGDGLCDKSTDDCLAFIIETNGLEVTFFAKVIELEADNDGKFHIKDNYTTTVDALSFNEGVIDVISGRRRRSTSDQVLATQYGVSVSNNGVNYGHVTYVTVLDTRCKETTNNSNGDIIVALVAGYCYIDGVCYGEGNSSAEHSCKKCRAAESLFDWTDENCPTTSTPVSDEGLPLYVIIFSATGGVVLIFIIVGGLVFFKHTQKKRPVTPLPSPPPYPGPAPVGPMNLRFYLKGLERESLDQYERPTLRT